MSSGTWLKTKREKIITLALYKFTTTLCGMQRLGNLNIWTTTNGQPLLIIC